MPMILLYTFEKYFPMLIRKDSLNIISFPPQHMASYLSYF